MLIVGYGNPLRGDDGVGWQAARYLADTLPDDQVEVIACHQLTPELAAAVSQADLVVFIDACCEKVDPCDEPAARVRCAPLQPSSLSHTVSSHHLDPTTLLACTRLLYGTCPPAVLITIAGDSFAYEEHMSSSVQACMPEVYAYVRTFLEAAQ